MLNNRELFLLNTAQTSNSPRMIEIAKAEGVYLYGPNGEEYMDLVSGFNVSNIGHRNPKVIQAIKDQLEKYLHVTVYGEFVQAPQVEFATDLLAVLPKQFESVYFTNSGAEAVEGSMKVAKRFTGRRQIIAAKKAYHGSTQGALSLIGNEEYHTAYAPLLPEIEFITFNNSDDLSLITEKTAAVIIEAIQGEAGVRVPDISYMQALRKRCNETGTLLVFDEIQTGFGRTGKLFAFEHYDIVPDILMLAKGIGGGMPLGAFVASKQVMDVIKDNPMLGHITTFGGHPVSCAAAKASLEFIRENQLVEQVAEKEQLFRTLLQHPKIIEIRGKGLMMCLQLETFDQVYNVSNYCAQQGIMIDWYLHCETALRVAPPLTITNDEIEKACKIILDGIEKYT
ncbi:MULTISPECIES: aspartate aminotransferase family protein [Sphingobacterium]|uniref:aspartate aminotransferase family protein n=1 Tax=Sphingobacterium TaxID=28453 RepID=UPI00104FF0A6|nr:MULTISPECIES: aspartate aminotransferase family protein [Sphingobacterium]MCW2262757.1 acetylornithine/succinyldiaminopimelate/putrescine aminotransferase [Sphingobacterium kitahiroshimense]NJI73710.1 aspartate aminotransferase family protein [Sphingobacterium sp. B16(2022)]TCR12251.1 acetylornithine/succinyldiaminopimelate/putrescine aminotransferase [Sphingobacterium sp. JUb78]